MMMQRKGEVGLVMLPHQHESVAAAAAAAVLILMTKRHVWETVHVNTA